jgi:hypothetical protein
LSCLGLVPGRLALSILAATWLTAAPVLAQHPPAPAPSPEEEARIPRIYLNQSGFNAGKPKRFTAPTLPDGSTFVVRPAAGSAPLLEGTIRGGIGDFSAFEPADAREYVVVAGPHTSVPFRVGPWWIERVTYQRSIDFMVDSRHYVGNVREVCVGSYGWRDDHHFGWELHALVPQYLSNPSAYDRMPHQVTYEAPTDRTRWGALERYDERAPDIVKLIHWGADVIVTQGLTHETLKSQLAYFLYAWPVLKDHLPAQNYVAVRDYAFAKWTDTAADRKYPYDESDDHNLLALKTRVGTTKGAYPPGFSIEPNLLMYEVAKREGRADAARYLKAATDQAAWIVDHIDWNDPLATKGQRMSEFITMTGLAHLLRQYPDRAPAGLVAKIDAWADVVIRRSANMWDFRKLDDGDRWTPMGEKPTMWNEPGNVVGFPAAVLAAKPFVRDASKQARLEAVAYAHLDNFFGRNPTGRHFSYDAPRELEGVEFGWYSFLPGGIGLLEHARFVIDGSPKDGHYPYHPERGNFGWTEGWVQFNTPYAVSLAQMAYSETRLAVRRDGDHIVVTLTAPLDFDYGKVETGEVWVETGRGDRERVAVTEDGPSARTFTGRVAIEAPRGKAVPADGRVQAGPQDTISVSYGFGYLAHRATLAGGNGK